MDNASESDTWLENIITGLQEIRDDPGRWQELELYAESLTTLTDVNGGNDNDEHESRLIYFLRNAYEDNKRRFTDNIDYELTSMLHQDAYNEIRATRWRETWETDEYFNKHVSELISKMYGGDTSITRVFTELLGIWETQYELE